MALAPLSTHVWQRRPSMLARIALAAYGLLIVDASLYPFTGWRDRGIGPFDYVFEAWPRHALEFDVLVNILGYMPFGLLVVLALYPRVRGFWAIVISVLASSALSASMEAIQTYIPARVASNVDLVTNIVGALLGALLAVRVAAPILDRGRLLQLRMQWFDRHASLGLVVVGLWFGAIIYPEQFAFGLGGLLGSVQGPLYALIGIDPAWEPSASQFAIAEAVVCGALLCSAGLMFLNLMRPTAPRLMLTIAFVAVTVIAKTLGTGMTYSLNNPFVWMTVGSSTGVLGGLLLLGVAGTASRFARSMTAILMLLVALALVNLVPENPYFDEATGHWAYGRFLNFYGLAYGLSVVWPLVALIYLCRPGARHWRTY